VEVNIGLIAQILTIVLALLSIYFGGKYRKAKRIMKELAEAVNSTYKALEDNQLTEEELRRVLKEWKDVLNTI